MTDLPPMVPSAYQRASAVADEPPNEFALFWKWEGTIATAYRDGQQSRQPEIDALKKLVYVPGLWRCPKCEFSLLQSNLNAVDGTVTARDDPGDKCPNCSSSLWRVTERQAGNDMVDRCEEQMRRAVEAEAKIDALRAALDESVKLQSHYADLLNMYDDGQRIIFKSSKEWLERSATLESKGNPNVPKT